jgi:hypothetical protein
VTLLSDSTKSTALPAGTEVRRVASTEADSYPEYSIRGTWRCVELCAYFRFLSLRTVSDTTFSSKLTQLGYPSSRICIPRACNYVLYGGLRSSEWLGVSSVEAADQLSNERIIPGPNPTTVIRNMHVTCVEVFRQP